MTITTNRGKIYEASYAAVYDITRPFFYAAVKTPLKLSEVAVDFDGLQWMKVVNKDTGYEYINDNYLTLDSIKRDGDYVDLRLVNNAVNN